MKIRLVKNSRIAKKIGVSAIVIYPFIFFSSMTPEAELINHEMIHVNQIKSYGIMKFYFLYLKEYLQNRLKGLKHNDAYLAISFEKEAYENQKKSS